MTVTTNIAFGKLFCKPKSCVINKAFNGRQQLTAGIQASCVILASKLDLFFFLL